MNKSSLGKLTFIGHSWSNHSAFYLYTATSAGFISYPLSCACAGIREVWLMYGRSVPCNWSTNRLKILKILKHLSFCRYSKLDTKRIINHKTRSACFESNFNILRYHISNTWSKQDCHFYMLKAAICPRNMGPIIASPWGSISLFDLINSTQQWAMKW